MTLTSEWGSGEKYQGPPPIAGIASHRNLPGILVFQATIITVIRNELSLLYAFPVAQSLSCCPSVIGRRIYCSHIYPFLYLTSSHPPHPKPLSIVAHLTTNLS